MSQRNDSTEVPVSSVSDTGVQRSDKVYIKVISKGEIKMIELNSDSYQSWADGMQLLLNAKIV